MRLQPIYLEVKPEDIAYIKFIFESYDGVGIIRTVDRKRAIVVLLAIDDLVHVAHQILESLKQDTSLNEIPKPEDRSDDWFMSELFAELESRER